MSLNWVMRIDDVHGLAPFVLLPNETLFFKLHANIRVDLAPIGQENPETLSINKGAIYLTSQRLVILDSTSNNKHLDTSEVDNFALFYEDIRYYKLDMPWFGSNKYKFLFKISDPNGGLNYMYQWSLVIHFIEGGAIEFNEKFHTIKTRSEYSQEDDLPAYSAT
ncbi:hypothetical protein WICMUC_003276 [Wickerhamomyces mucosus]|uniref:Uncharacterized protein n=1 Tax=Wickerhamomyces mucosus TaxID=1378264 RepID=A0A9P8PN39_9ASCO|nr:hypothetical protein WICMUC_003276 [Wickerhamomyces mucosus]